VRRIASGQIDRERGWLVRESFLLVRKMIVRLLAEFTDLQISTSVHIPATGE